MKSGDPIVEYWKAPNRASAIYRSLQSWKRFFLKHYEAEGIEFPWDWRPFGFHAELVEERE